MFFPKGDESQKSHCRGKDVSFSEEINDAQHAPAVSLKQRVTCCFSPAGRRAEMRMGLEAEVVEQQDRSRSDESTRVASLRFRDGQQLAIWLGLSFAILIAIFVGTGYWAIGRVEQISRGLREAITSRADKLQLAEDALRHSNQNSQIMMDLLLLKKVDAAAPLLARRAENTQRVLDLIRNLENQCDSVQEKQLLLAIRQSRDPYVDRYQEVVRLLLDQHNGELAEDVLLQQTTPALFTYHAAWNEFVKFELEQMKQATLQSRESYFATRRITWALVLLSGFLASAIALFVTRRIAKEARTRDRIYRRLKSLNAELERRVAQRTEELARRDDQLRGSLEELQEYTREIEAINELVELLQSCLTLDEARQQATRVLQQFFSSGAVLMLNSSRNLLDVALSWGASTGKQGPFIPDSCWALRKGRLHLVQPRNLSLLCSHTDEASAPCHLCIPMVAQGDSQGVLTIDDPGLCDSADGPRSLRRKQELATTVAEQISLAFANLMLRETLKYQSVRDPLTGLFNRRHMEESFGRELLRAARNTKPVTVMMMDIDHFKRFNDTFGHEAGDVLLRELGSMLNSQARGGDIACRYGGEEFLLIMAEMGLEAAQQRAEKLREQVKDLQIRHRGETLRRITVSIGVACFPENGASTAQILKAADEALYRAKAAGRDRVALATTGRLPALVPDN
jgi:diguanylate cyclase (GGDEF)-like protein